MNLDTLVKLFDAGMARDYPEIVPIKPPGLNLGAGNKKFEGWKELQLPAWNAEVDPIPYPADSQQSILAFHFLEHIYGHSIPCVLKECERVLKVGGTLNIVVPHRLGSMAYQDPDHKTFFTENTWRLLLDNDYYDRPWDEKIELEIVANFIMGESEKNLALVTQFIKPIPITY